MSENKYLDMINALLEAKDLDDKPLFNDRDIGNILKNDTFQDIIGDNPKLVETALNNPKQIGRIANSKNKEIRFTTILSLMEEPTPEKKPYFLYSDKKTDIAKNILSEVKDSDDKPLFEDTDISAIIVNCSNMIVDNIERFRAIFNNPKEIERIITYPDKVAGACICTYNPLSSTIEKNPEAFGKADKHLYMINRLLEAKDCTINRSSLFNEEELGHVLHVYKDRIQKHPDQIIAMIGILEDRIGGYKGASKKPNIYKEQHVAKTMVLKHPDAINALFEAKDLNGKPLFHYWDIGEILHTCNDTIEKDPKLVEAVLNNPEEIKEISKSSREYSSRALSFSSALRNPKKSTIEKKRANENNAILPYLMSRRGNQGK